MDAFASLLPPAALTAGLFALGSQLTLSALFAFILPQGPWTAQPAYTAHQAVAFVTMIYVTSVGAAAWFHPDAELLAASATTFSRVERAHPIGDHLAQVLLGLNVMWDIPFGFIAESLRVRSNAFLMFIHHVAVVLVTWLAIGPPARFQYYAVFFFGVIEVSSVPMALMDVCHPRNAEWASLGKRSSLLAGVNSACRVIFAISYMATRAIYFPYVIVTGVMPDALQLLALPSSPLSKVSLSAILVSAALLTALQLHWAWLLVQQALGLGQVQGGLMNAGKRKST
jgi:hypothetical protein